MEQEQLGASSQMRERIFPGRETGGGRASPGLGENGAPSLRSVLNKRPIWAVAWVQEVGWEGAGSEVGQQQLSEGLKLCHRDRRAVLHLRALAS